MTRILAALSILAATAVAVPASAGSVTVSLTGKSTAERYAALQTAAKTVCVIPNDIAHQVDGDCVVATLRKALTEIGDPTLTQYALSMNYTKVASN